MSLIDKSKIKLNVISPLEPKVSCPEHVAGYCKWLSKENGKLELATGPRCQKCNGDKPESLALDVLPVSHRIEFVSRVAKESVNAHAGTPLIWYQIKAALQAAGVYDCSAVRAVYLTGSILCGKQHPKDVDVVILIDPDRITEWLGAGIILPETVADIPMDYFYHTKLSPFYPMLDGDHGRLLTPLFLGVGLQRSKLLPTPIADWTPAQQEILRRIGERAMPPAKAMVDEVKKPASPSDCGCSRASRKAATA